ncbi:MAG: hypothetical protein OXC30_01730 [Alphaproteobacteria bacterium]|nr:hypothetical protein [Alphaproteobacteria bacterium]
MEIISLTLFLCGVIGFFVMRGSVRVFYITLVAMSACCANILTSWWPEGHFLLVTFMLFYLLAALMVCAFFVRKQ